MTHIQRTHPKYREFRFDAGSCALNFVATLRHRGSQPHELLVAPDDLALWLRLAELYSEPLAIAPNELQQAIHLREAIHDTLRRLILQQPVGDEPIAVINSCARLPTAVPQLELGAQTIVWINEQPLNACLATLARDAIELIASPMQKRLKFCAYDGCQMLFLDASPSNRRRWCNMTICGNREKVALHRKKKQELLTSTGGQP
jgi:predicted RNA-binding Zn ribbon-like protein